MQTCSNNWWLDLGKISKNLKLKFLLFLADFGEKNFFDILGNFSLFSSFFGLFVKNFVKIYAFLSKSALRWKKYLREVRKFFIIGPWLDFNVPCLPMIIKNFQPSRNFFSVFVTKTGCYVNKATFFLELSNFFWSFWRLFSLFSWFLIT